MEQQAIADENTTNVPSAPMEAATKVVAEAATEVTELADTPSRQVADCNRSCRWPLDPSRSHWNELAC